MKVKDALLKVGVICMRGIYAPMKLQKKQNRITIISRQSDSISLDIALLSDFIRVNYPDLDCSVLVKFIGNGIKGKVSYAFHILSQMNAIAKSKVVVLDGYCIAASVLNHGRDTKIIQLWHSMAAIKQFGHQTIDKPSGHSHQVAEIMCMHRNYDYVLCPSMKTGEYFCKGFNCSRDILVEMCLPRIDYIKEKEEKLLETDKEILLYAPTFRKNECLRAEDLFRAIDFNRFILVIKPHPLDKENLRETVKSLGLKGKIIVDDEYGTFRWMKDCDRIITDYSAVAVECLVTGKPLYFYVYDIDEYTEKVGLNVNPIEEMPEISAKSATELMKMLGNEYDYEALNRFKDTYLTADTDRCAEKLAKFIVGVLNGNAKKTWT